MGGQPALLVKPLTFMNASGPPVGSLARKKGIAPADVVRQREIVLPRVGASHQIENAVVAGLQRQVDVLADFRMAGHGVQQGGRKILGVRRGKAHAFDARHVGHGQHEFREVPIRESVRIHVLPEQRDLLVAVGGQMFDPPEDALRVARPLAPARVGDDAEAAEVVAAAHDGEPGIHALGAFGKNVIVGFVFREVHGQDALGLFVLLCLDRLREQIGQAAIGIRPGQHVHERLGFGQLLFQILGHAAQHAHHHRRVFLLHGLKLLQS